jgi:hypothetical protein
VKQPALFVDTLRRHYQLIALFTGYIAFTWSCYLLVQFGFVLIFGFMVPEPWWGPLAFTTVDPYALHYLKFGLKFAVAFAPVLTVLAVSMAWFARLFQFKPVPLWRLALSVPANVGIGLPFFLLIPFLMFLNLGPVYVLIRFVPPDWIFPAVIVTVFLGVALVYLALTSILSSRNPAQFARRFLSSGRFWLAFTVTCILLAVAILNLVSTLFVRIEIWITIQLENLVLTALPVAFVAPALPLVVEYFGNQEPLK